MGNIVASIIVKFSEGADSSALYKVELDSLLNLDDAGEVKNQFSPGDPVNFLVNHGRELRIGNVLATDGMINATGQLSRQRSDSLLFRDEEETGELGYFPAGPLSQKWYGNQAQSLSRADRTITVSGGVYPCRVKLDYIVFFHGYRLITPAMELAEKETYPIDIVVYFEATAT